MKKIRITVGTYGYRKDNKSPVVPINKNSAPIEVSDAEAKRLIELGVAECVADAGTDPIVGHLDAGQFEEYSHKELQKLAKDMGLKASGSKEELIERITAAEVEIPAEDEADAEVSEDADPEEPPVSEDADPEEPPVSEDADPEEPPVLEAADPE